MIAYDCLVNKASKLSYVIEVGHAINRRWLVFARIRAQENVVECHAELCFVGSLWCDIEQYLPHGEEHQADMDDELVRENVILDVLVDGTQNEVVLEFLSLFLANLTRLVWLIISAIITQI